MRTLTIGRPTASSTIAAVLLAAFVLLFAWPSSAAAHDALVESSPAADATVDTLPAELTLTFSAALIGGEGATEVVVTDPEGEAVAEGPAQVDGALVTQPLATDAPAGEYHVLWKVVSSDGHPTSGEFSFTVTTGSQPEEPSTAPAEEAPAAPAPEQSQTSEPVEDPNMESIASFSPGWLIAGAVILLIVAFLLFLLLRRRRPAESGSDAPSER
ncbi:copper resistance CopC family protein [Microbacterium paludicola]|uniref:copper resistance CopC family protein n=1 Tax=Microbacterium paludicola TaxID=300019 RepID=UPI0011A06F52|nr:copper resistance CopC family protein [Microbacterium paludicola]